MSEKPPKSEVIEGEWEGLIEYGDKNAIDIKNEVANEQNDFGEVNKSDEIASAKQAVVDALDASSAEKEQPVMVKFCGEDIPKDMLGEDLIIIDEVKPRPKLDFIGRAKDERVYYHLLDTKTLDEEAFRKEFTPQVAALFVDHYINGGESLGSPMAQRMLEALPLDLQEKYFSRPCSPSYIATCIEESGFNSSMREKLFAGFLSSVKKDDLSDNDIFALTSNAHDALSVVTAYYGKGQVVDKAEVFNRVVEAYNENPGMTKEAESLLRIYLATTLDRDYFNEHFNELIDYDYAKDNINLVGMSQLQFCFGNFSQTGDALQQKMDTLSPQLATLSKKMINEGVYNYQYDINESEAERINIFLGEFSETVSDEETLLPIIMAKNQGSLNVIKQIQQMNGVFDPELKRNVEEYFRNQCSFELGFPYAVDIPVTDLNQLRDWDEFFKQSLRTELGKLMEDDPEKARNAIARCLYGADLEEIGLNLTALGVMNIKKISGRGDIEDYSKRQKKSNIKINMDVLEKFVEQGGQEDGLKLKGLVLDVIDYMTCPDERLLERYDDFVKNGKLDGADLGDVLGAVRKEKRKEMSRNYSRLMQELIRQGVKESGSVELDGVNIPLLKMDGDDFLFLVHHLGAYSDIRSDNPAQWNDRGRKLANGGSKVMGYISTCAIAPGCIHLAAKKREITGPNEVFYGFTNFGENTLLYASEYDLWTYAGENSRGDKEIRVERQDFFDEDPRAIIKRTQQSILKNDHGHNEVVLDRYSGGEGTPGGKLQPNYLIVFSSDPNNIGDTVKKHAAYFGVPIMMVDYQRYK